MINLRKVDFEYLHDDMITRKFNLRRPLLCAYDNSNCYESLSTYQTRQVKIKANQWDIVFKYFYFSLNR